jgi:hypothetical protein
MKLEKDDRIISNSDYQKLVGLAELHEKAIAELVYDKIMRPLKDEMDFIYGVINQADKTHDLILGIKDSEIKYLESNIKSLSERIETKNRIIQEKNTEIARLQKKYWWKLI